MKARHTLIISLLSSISLLGLGTTCGAKLIQPAAKKSAKTESSAPLAPELQSADLKISKAKEQLETAKKQLEAARALVRAAEADFKAARAAREALALQLKADGLAGASGLKQIAAQPAANKPAANNNQAPAPDGGQRAQTGDFNSEPQDAPQLR